MRGIENVTNEEKQIEVTVCCTTYNHAKYMRMCLDSLVSQRTSFRYEIIIHDDCSSDGTQDIIKEYCTKYPKLIVPILQEENQFSKGKTSFDFYYPLVKGKYVSFCEGDDFWCDSEKLQKQFDALEEYQSCSICVHNIKDVDNESNALKTGFPRCFLPEGIISAADYIHLELVECRWLFQTSSFFIRKEIFDERYKLGRLGLPVGDLALVLFSLNSGSCYYIKQTMSCYRRNVGFVASINSKKEKEIKHYKELIDGYERFDEYYNYKYHKDFLDAEKYCNIQMLMLTGAYKDIAKNYDYGQFGAKYKMMVFIGCICPRMADFFVDLYKKRK